VGYPRRLTNLRANHRETNYAPSRFDFCPQARSAAHTSLPFRHPGPSSAFWFFNVGRPGATDARASWLADKTQRLSTASRRRLREKTPQSPSWWPVTALRGHRPLNPATRVQSALDLRPHVPVWVATRRTASRPCKPRFLPSPLSTTCLHRPRKPPAFRRATLWKGL